MIMNKIFTLFALMLMFTSQCYAAEVYLFRGAAGKIFSTGLDDLGKRLKRNGHKVYVLAHGNSNAAFREIVTLHLKHVSIIGHSMGGKTAIRLAQRLVDRGVKVCLIATIDPVGAGIVPANVRVALNWWQGRFSRLIAGKGFKGHLRNFKMTGWRHIDLDEAAIIHNRIATVLGSRCR
ncbi:MAG: hypothetical protein COA78_33390 [Blastopirellula sp.]|nr:MAG: hypothetical protein COA78_33390 [Blastopirellula sp.]